MKTLFLAWQDSISRTWFPVGKLTHENGVYHFDYIQGAITASEKANFQPIWSFPDFKHHYTSVELFPLFANRLLRPSRPDYQDFIQWLNFPEDPNDPIALLARSGGKRRTDSFEVFPYPERDANGIYHIHFFAHGLRHCPSESQQYVKSLTPGTKLFVAHDAQNEFDSRALFLRTEDKRIVGYCPRYLSQDFFKLVCDFPHKVQVVVERVNLPPTPIQFRLLCSLTADWADDFQLFSDPIFQVVSSEVSESSSAVPATAVG